MWCHGERKGRCFVDKLFPFSVFGFLFSLILRIESGEFYQMTPYIYRLYLRPSNF